MTDSIPWSIIKWVDRQEDKIFPINRVYVYFLLAGIFFHLIAAGCTWYALSNHPTEFIECNGVMANQFDQYGHIISEVYCLVIIIGYFFGIPLLFNESKIVGYRSVICLVLLTGFLFVDAASDLALILNIMPVHDAAFTVMSATNGGNAEWRCE